MSKIGVFMGSFDPPHIGHISVVTEVLNSGLVDDVYIVPAWKNVWKSTTTSFDSRVLMCSIALLELRDKVRISRAEENIANTNKDYLSNGVPSYVTMNEFVKMHHLIYNSVYFITTKETYLEIPLWENGESILSRYEFIVCGYNGDVSIPHIDMSSTVIRERIRQNKEVYPYITSDVKEYIKKLNLYI